MSKRRIAVFIAALILLGLIEYAPHLVRADCQVTGSAGSDDVVLCANSADTDGIDTGAGNDRLTVQAGIEVSRSSGPPIHTQSGDDLVQNYGLIRGAQSGLNLGSGSDQLDNYGGIEAQDSPVTCAPAQGQTCVLYNHTSGVIRADLEVLDTNSTGGHMIVYNDGALHSTIEEAIHLHGSPYNVIKNKGAIYGGSSGIEVYPGTADITNSGSIEALNETAIDLHNGDDKLYNSGTITSHTLPALRAGGGRDTLTNTGLIVGDMDLPTEGLISMEDGDDLINVTSGAIRETGLGYAIEAGFGSDTVIVQGGSVEGLILGDDHTGRRIADVDTLVFELYGTQSEIDAFRAAAEAQQPANGSVTWRSNTYRWRGFEKIELRLSVGAPPTPTPIPSPTPSGTSSSLPGSLVAALPGVLREVGA